MIIEVSEDLVLEVWPAGAGDRSLVKLVSRGLARDGETAPGVVVIWPEEIRPLVIALADAAGALAEAVGGGDARSLGP